MKKLLYLILPLMLLFLVTSCGDKNIELSYENNKVETTVGEVINVKPNVIGEDVTLKYTLSSDIAEVDNNGNLKALKAGEVVVSVTAEEDDKATAKLIVVIKEKESYTITFDVNGGEALSKDTISFTDASKVVLPTPTKSGYKFLGWYEGETLVSKVTNKNYNLVAKWEELVGETYTISYDVTGGTLPTGAVTSFKENETVNLPTPTKSGYKFLGWYEGETLVSKVTNKNYNLVAKWEELVGETYTISYDVAGGTLPTGAVTSFKENETVALPTPTKEGFKFIGWYENNTLVEKLTNKNYNLVAKWEELKTYTISWDLAGGEWEGTPGVTTFKENEVVSLPDAKKDGYIFLGWYIAEPLTEVKVIENRNYELVARWFASDDPGTDDPGTDNPGNDDPVVYTITYDLAGGTNPSDAVKSFTDASKVVLPTPTKAGYVFKGWYENNTLVESLTSKNYTLVAKWEQVPTGVIVITYVLDSGVQLANYESRSELIAELVADIQTIKGSTYTLSYFESATGTGYNLFAGTEGSKTFFADATMRAKWSWILEYAKSLRSAAGLDVAQYDSVINNGYLTADSATINMEMMGFIGAKQLTYEASATTIYTTSDYSKATNNNGFWGALHQKLVKQNTFNSSVSAKDALPNATKNGAIFDGWYTSSDFVTTSKLTDSSVISTSITVYPKFIVPSGDSTTVVFDYDGGISDVLLDKYGTKLTTLVVSSYNGAFWSGTNYASDTFISNSGSDPLAKFSTRIYIGKDQYTGLYSIISILPSGTTSTWPIGAEYVITISGQYAGTNDDNFSSTKISVGNYVIFNKDIPSISSTSPATVNFYTGSLEKDEISVVVDSSFVVPEPTKVGYAFDGWYDDNGKKYEKVSDFLMSSNLTVKAKWKFEDHLIGEFATNSWVAAGDNILLRAEYAGGSSGTVKWESKTPSIASVDQYGYVTGIGEGVATIVVSDVEYPEINFTFYVTVLASAPTGIEKVLLESNNSSIFTRDDLGIGAGTPAYYYDVVGSVSKLLFEDYVVHDDYYLANPNNKSSLASGGIQFITVHYAADMPYSASAMLNGGRNLASYNQSCNNGASQASWHYSVGNDGVWSCQSEAYGAWHAGSSKAMSWYNTGVTTSKVGTDVYTTDVTLGSDGYFYIKGVKTTVKNTTGYTRLNSMGLAVKLVGNEWQIGGCYYNSTYKYISSQGGNNNSIGMETSVREGSDLWLTWQYTAQLCAKLLLKYNLPIQRLVGHHFFSGKDCPQPMLANDLEIWYEFVELVAQEMALYQNYSSYSISATSNSAYVNNRGRVTTLPNYSECVTYTVTYKSGSTTKTLTLSSIIPGKLA